MLGRHKVSLNAIAETSTIGLIQAVLDAGVNLTEVGGYCCRCCRHMFAATCVRVGLQLKLTLSCSGAATSGTIEALWCTGGVAVAPGSPVPLPFDAWLCQLTLKVVCSCRCMWTPLVMQTATVPG